MPINATGQVPVTTPTNTDTGNSSPAAHPLGRELLSVSNTARQSSVLSYLFEKTALLWYPRQATNAASYLSYLPSSIMNSIAGIAGTATHAFGVLEFPGKALLSGHAAYQQQQQYQQIQTQQAALALFKERDNTSSTVSPADIRAAQEYLAKLSDYMQNGMTNKSMESLSWGTGFLSSAITLTNIALPAAMPLSVFSSVVGYVAPFVLNQLTATTFDKQDEFRGQQPGQELHENIRAMLAEYRAMIDASTDISQEEKITDTAQLMHRCQEIIAETELQKIIQDVVKKDTHQSTQATIVRQRVQDRLADAHKKNYLTGVVPGSSMLLNSDLEMIKALFNSKYGNDFFTGNKDNITQKLLDNVLDNMKELSLKTPSEEVRQIRDDDRSYINESLPSLQSHARFLRAQLTEYFVDLVHEKTQQNISNESGAPS